mmetsp:Transcript_23329/g.40692  ORF Transcript_23329/g.40692 Transcript_23329/m.40692 type:complete len:211 (-) Transcript_23329:617-1249(-)
MFEGKHIVLVRERAIQHSLSNVLHLQTLSAICPTPQLPPGPPGRRPHFENWMSSTPCWVSRPASWTGSTQASSSVSLWCECHQPGGVVNTPPARQSMRTGSFTHPRSSSSGPISVYTPPEGGAATHRSRATELCLCGRWLTLAGITFRRDHSTWVSVIVPFSVTLFPRRMPNRFLCWAVSSLLRVSTSACIRSLVYSVGLNFLVVGATPK